MAKSGALFVNVDIPETRVALVEDGKVVEFYIERECERSVEGNVYLGRVERVIPGMQASFVDIGMDKSGFLQLGEAMRFLDEMIAETGDGDGDRTRSAAQRSIRDLLREGQEVLVQVSRAPIGSKGARVTPNASLAGRYVVYLPQVSHLGVSRRITDDSERRRLREIVASHRSSEDGGFVCRTAAAGCTEDALRADIDWLKAEWARVLRGRTERRAPALLRQDYALPLRAVRDAFSGPVDRVVTDDPDVHREMVEYVGRYMPERVGAVDLYGGDEPLFDAYGIEEELKRALQRRVPLPSGGSIVIDQAEALTAIDVNTGKFVGKHDFEETIFRNNIEAVAEIAYQLRFRNIGGLIIIDFIDMESEENREKTYRALLEALRGDKARTSVIRISEMGLVEMTRKRTRASLGGTLNERCWYCEGAGTLRSVRSVCYEIMREIRREVGAGGGDRFVVRAHPHVREALLGREKAFLDRLSEKLGTTVKVEAVEDLHVERFEMRRG